MSHTIDWLVHGHIMHITFSGDVSVEELRSISIESHQLFEAYDGNNVIHVMMDMTALRQMPMDMKVHLQAMGRRRDPRQESTVLISSNRRFSMVVGFVANFIKTQFVVHASYDEAIEFLRYTYKNIPWEASVC